MRAVMAATTEIGELDYRERDDRQLVDGILARDRASFEELDRRYRRRVFGLVSRRVTDYQEAEDVTQEVFLQVYRCLRRYEGRSSLLTWIFGIANNQIFRYYRRRAATPIPTEDASSWTPVGPRDSLERQVDATRVLARCARVLDERVSDSQREVFCLRYLQNESTRSIAQQLGKSRDAVKISLFRTRHVLHERAGADLESVLAATG